MSKISRPLTPGPVLPIAGPGTDGTSLMASVARKPRKKTGVPSSMTMSPSVMVSLNGTGACAFAGTTRPEAGNRWRQQRRGGCPDDCDQQPATQPSVAAGLDGDEPEPGRRSEPRAEQRPAQDRVRDLGPHVVAPLSSTRLNRRSR